MRIQSKLLTYAFLLFALACRGDISMPSPAAGAQLGRSEDGVAQLLTLDNYLKDAYLLSVKGACKVQRSRSAGVSGREITALLPDKGFFNVKVVRRSELTDTKVGVDRGWTDGSRARVILPSSLQDRVLVTVWEHPSARAQQFEYSSSQLAARLRAIDAASFHLGCE